MIEHPKRSGGTKFPLVVRVTLLAVVAALLALAGVSGAHAAPAYPLDTRLTPKPMPEVARPGYLDPITDPTFGTTITRISDLRAFDTNNDTLRHAYAKNQPWNADGSLIMLDYQYPAAVLDGETYEFLRWVHQPSLAAWSNVDPFKTIGTASRTNRLVSADMRRDWDRTTIRKFRGYDTINFGQGEGNLSNDDRYIALFGIKSGHADLFVYDLENNRVVSRRDLGNATIGDGSATINNATMSQSGEFVFVEYNAYGPGKKRGIVAFDRDLSFLRQLSHNGGSHYDACLDARGRDTVVVQGNSSSSLVSVRPDTGARTRLLGAGKLNYSIHISCRNLDRPGWAYISEFADDPARNANYQEIFAVRLDGSGTVNRFAHEHHSANRVYKREPHAVPNRDGSKVLWASDWGKAKGPVYAYTAE